MAATLEQLNAFVITVDKGSFKQASYQIGKHTSTVSGLIANLEAELGIELFIRKPRSLEITPAGSELYQYAKSVLREFDLLDVKANSLIEGLPSSLTIAVDSDLMGAELSAVFASILSNYPALELKVLSTDPMQVRGHVLNEQADVGFGVSLFSGHHELTLADGYSFDVTFVASPALGFKEQVVPLERVRGQLQVGALFMKQLGKQDTHNLSSRIIYSNNSRSTLELLLQSNAWAMLPSFICERAIAAGDLEEFYISPTGSVRANQWATELSWLTAKPKNAAMDLFIKKVAQLPNR
ncbi:LysR family transcriptional regulator [Alginatibacterium sediminis]|uniref:LysR family transcriptional regulator n=1 Tax=Alginatibacterium sediminis TaxID=2164068 RepID=A0A420EBG0_9ALTE|nr:LysR family transcriptional regulator [Alginatibacterium sediminis]RKF18011.1 LysR family transcriptional regulator [Alginatibacterium sediminis]